MPPREKRKPQVERRSDGGAAPTAVMQAYLDMTRKGRRRLMWIGMIMNTAAGAVGLFGSVMSFYRFIVVLVFLLVGVGFIFPQMGLKLFELVPDMIARIGPDKLFGRPDRRNQE